MFFFKQKTAYEMRISDCSSDVCSSDLDDNWIMAYVHIAHDCKIGSHTVIANSVQLAGHIHIGDWAILGGLTAVHQFVRIGAHTMIGGTSSEIGRAHV